MTARTHVRASTASHAVVRNTIVTAVMSVARECAAAALDVVSIGLVYTVRVRVKTRFPVGSSGGASVVQVAHCVSAMYE